MKSIKFIFIPTIFISSTFNSFYFEKPNFFVKDFESNKEEARKWGESHNHNWINNLSHPQRVALIHYSSTPWHFNSYLRKTEGKLITEKPQNIPQDIWNEYEKTKTLTRIKDMDSALKMLKTTESVKVYRRLNEDIFSFENGSLRSGNNKITNKNIFVEIKNKIENTTFVDHGYVSASLVRDAGKFFNSKNRPILWEINVPKGIHGAFLGKEIGTEEQQEFVISRCHSYKLKNISIINEVAYQSLKIDVDIIHNPTINFWR